MDNLLTSIECVLRDDGPLNSNTLCDNPTQGSGKGGDAFGRTRSAAETTYLLLVDSLPREQELDQFNTHLRHHHL